MALKINRNRVLLVLLIVVANILLDQWTKGWAQTSLMGVPPISYLNDFFRLSYVENTGAFLSLGSDLPSWLHFLLLKALPVLMLGGLLVYTLFSDEMTRWQYVAFSFILGGGISNVVDRILYGQVVDFMNMGFPGLRTGIFNTADVSIMFGLGLMIPTFVQQYRATRRREATQQ